MKARWAVAVVILIAAGRAPAADEAALERPAQPFDRAAHVRREGAQHSRLVASQVTVGFGVPLTVELTGEDRIALTEPSSREGRLRVGVVKPIGVTVDFSDLPRGPLAGVGRRRTVGAIRGTAGGGYVWTAVVESADARALRLHLEKFQLPDGAALSVYNAAGRVGGPYTGAGPLGTNEFWTHTIAGSTLVLQLEVPAHARGGRAPTFDIAQVGHLGPGFLLGTRPAPEAGSNLCNFNAACVVNASCATIPAMIEDARDAVALIEFVSGAFLYICSGGLVADTNVTTQIPYFLTANHCLDREQEADSVEAFFQYSTSCGGTCVDPDGVAPSALGSDIMATDKGTDFTLLRLSESPPGGSAFLGWTNTPVAFTNGVPLFRISHPAGAPQAYSEHVVDTSRGTCQKWPRGDRIYSSDVFGATEGEAAAHPFSMLPDRWWDSSPGRAGST